MRYGRFLVHYMPMFDAVHMHLLMVEHNAAPLRAPVEVVAITLFGEGAGVYDEYPRQSANS